MQHTRGGSKPSKGSAGPGRERPPKRQDLDRPTSKAAMVPRHGKKPSRGKW